MALYSEDFWKKIEEFRTVVVPTAGIKSDMHTAYAQWKRGKGSECWALPRIRTWEGHLKDIWKRSQPKLFDKYRLLTPTQFHYRWLQAGLQVFLKDLREKDEDEVWWRRKYVSRLCDDAIQTWRLLHDYDIASQLREPEYLDKIKPGSLHDRFREWCCQYRKKAANQNWLSEAELATTLREEISKHGLFSEYETDTLFFTVGFDLLPAREKYIDAATEHGHHVKREHLDINTSDDSRGCGIEFADTNQEAQAAAAWARRRLEDHLRDDSSDQSRIGIVVPNLVGRKLALERQFLARLCPDGHRAWEVPRLLIDDGRSLADDPVCQVVRSYIHACHQPQIAHSKAALLVHSGRCSGLIPSDFLSELAEKTSHDLEIASDIDLPPNAERDDKGRNTLSDWMNSFQADVNKCRKSLRKSLLDAFNECRKGLQKSAPESLASLRAAANTLEDLICSNVRVAP